MDRSPIPPTGSLLSPSAQRLVGLLAAAGVMIVGAGELLLHWTGAQGSTSGPGTPFDFLLSISRSRLVAGHSMAVLTGPSYFLGYWQVSQRLAPASPLRRRIFFGASLWVLGLALVWIGSRAYLARSLQIVAEPDLQRALADEYTLLLESLIWGLRIGMAGLSVAFVVSILRGTSSYPRWMAAANPLVLLLLVFATAAVPWVGHMLIPAALNVAHVPFFLLSALVPIRPPVRSRP